MPQPTTSQMTVLHSILSAAVAVIIGAGTAGTQFYLSHGQDLWLTFVFFGGTLGTTFAAIRVAVWHAIITSPALPQAEKDSESQALQVATQAMQGVGNISAHITNNIMPLLHQHPAPQPQQPLTGPAVSRAVTTPAARPPQPITFPASVANTAPHVSFGETGAMPVVPPSA